jgi:hypothetical protein
MAKLIKLAGITNPVDLDAPIYAGSNFTWREATKNGERIPTQSDFEGMTIAAGQITSNIIKIAKELDEIRKIYNRPIIINSWYRDPKTNRKVGGVRNSQHILGWAADIQVHGIDPNEVAAKLASGWAGGLGDSESFTHLDLRHLLGRAAARWDYGNA